MYRFSISSTVGYSGCPSSSFEYFLLGQLLHDDRWQFFDVKGFPFLSNYSDDRKSNAKHHPNVMGDRALVEKSIDGTGRQSRRFRHDDNTTRTTTAVSTPIRQACPFVSSVESSARPPERQRDCPAATEIRRYAATRFFVQRTD